MFEDDDEVVVINSDDDEQPEENESEQEPAENRYSILQPVITRVVDALGGYEKGVYRLGDEANACLRDLKKLWRKDDDDDERTVARIFWKTRVFANDLVPILLETAGKGMLEDKRAISCADLMTAMTWPIDMAEELKELDEDLDKGTDYTQLLQSHLHYKSALLKPGVMQALFGIIVPPLAKPPKERTERDGQVINVVLHLIRNMAFIRDLPTNINVSADLQEFSGLQNRLVKALSDTNTIDLLLTIASNADNDPLFTTWNTLVLEILYLLFRGVQPSALVEDPVKTTSNSLHKLLAAENESKRSMARTAASRHSRFGTTISVQLNPKKASRQAENVAEPEAGPSTKDTRSFVLHRQQAVTGDTGAIWDMKKRSKARKATTVDVLSRADNLSVESRKILQHMATEFIEACFNPFLAGILKDIRSERPKIVEKDHLRLLYVAKWFLDYFLRVRTKQSGSKDAEQKTWEFGLIAEVTERAWIGWVLRRMREAVEDKPKLWTELQAGIECLTQLLLLIDTMAASDIEDAALHDAATVLQHQLIYNGEILDVTLESLKVYKEGTQSLAFLDSSVHMAYVLLKILEQWSKGRGANDVYVRKRKAKRRKRQAEEDGVPDVEEVEEVEEKEDIQEVMFTFEAFEGKFANAEITSTLLRYLAMHRGFDSPDKMKRVVSLLHRQAIRAKAEGLFFNVSTLYLFKTILDEQKSLPRDQSYKDLINLINYILRKFFKEMQEDTFLGVEAFFPKNGANWKKHSSWEPEKKAGRETKAVDDTRFPPEVQVKKGYSWSDQLGIAIAALTDDGQDNLIEWLKSILSLVISTRSNIIRETDSKSDDDDDDDNPKIPTGVPSSEAMSKITDFMIPYEENWQADAATKNSKFKLLLRLSKCYVIDEDEQEWEWYIPAAILPSELQSILTVINQFLESPLDLEGKSAAQLLGKKRRRKRKARPVESDADEDAEEDEPKVHKRKEKKKKEKEQYKSAQFIVDSDDDMIGTMEEFLEQEKQRRIKAELAAANAETGTTTRPVGMRATGTKKRRRKDEGKPGGRKKHKADSEVVSTAESGVDESEDRPLPVKAALLSPIRSPSPTGRVTSVVHEDVASSDEDNAQTSRPTRKAPRLIISDEEDD